MQFFLDFEKPLVELEQKIKELRGYSTDSVDFSSDISKLEKKADKLREEIFSNLTRWQDSVIFGLSAEPRNLSVHDIIQRKY